MCALCAARAAVRTDMDAVRPTSTNEEDAQLEMALAMSRQQHEEEERLRKGDEIKLQMAIEESRKTAQHEVGAVAARTFILRLRDS